MNLNEALKELKALGDAKVRAQNAKGSVFGQGAGDNQFGVSLGDIRALAKKIKTDHELALKLWDTGNVEAQLVATLIIQPGALSAGELDKLTLHQAGFLAQKRLARGVRLNHPEAVALIATVLLEFIRDGRSVAELMNLGRQLLGRNQVMPGVPEMIYDVQVEGTFPDGSKLVTVHHPIAAENGDLKLALHGSFLPEPSLALFPPAAAEPVPGSSHILEGEIVLNAGRNTAEIPVTNLGDRPIQVTGMPFAIALPTLA